VSLTTLRDLHVEIRGATLQFRFRGKSGKDHSIVVNDRRLASIVRRCQELPGYELFQYVDPQGQSKTEGQERRRDVE
jgi:DNA topoisomerase-1